MNNTTENPTNKGLLSCECHSAAKGKVVLLDFNDSDLTNARDFGDKLVFRGVAHTFAMATIRAEITRRNAAAMKRAGR